MAIAELPTSRLEELLGERAQDLLSHRCQTISASELHLLGPDFVDRVLLDSDRSTNVLHKLHWLRNSGRLAGTGYVSILPVDQGIEHSGGASFAANPRYFDPANLVELAIEGGCNALASTLDSRSPSSWVSLAEHDAHPRRPRELKRRWIARSVAAASGTRSVPPP